MGSRDQLICKHSLTVFALRHVWVRAERFSDGREALQHFGWYVRTDCSTLLNALISIRGSVDSPFVFRDELREAQAKVSNARQDEEVRQRSLTVHNELVTHGGSANGIPRKLSTEPSVSPNREAPSSRTYGVSSVRRARATQACRRIAIVHASTTMLAAGRV